VGVIVALGHWEARGFSSWIIGSFVFRDNPKEFDTCLFRKCYFPGLGVTEDVVADSFW